MTTEVSTPPLLFSNRWSRNDKGEITEFELLPCPCCGADAKMRAFRYSESEHSENVYIRCSSDDCDLSGPTTYISGKPEDEPMSNAAIKKLLARWHRRQAAVQTPPALKEIPDDALLGEIKRRLVKTERRPDYAYGYVSKTDDGRYAMSLWEMNGRYPGDEG